ncbi:MAG: hypothetical protein KJP07_00385 [Desulfatitalea sp.]|nr:hypothetical protein [Desulfatitalea sp.]
MTSPDASWRHWAFPLCVLVPLILIACSAEVQESETYISKGLLFCKGADKPFAGIVVGRSVREGYRRQAVYFKKRYKYGKLNGRSYYYYPSGGIESIEPYKDGVLTGVVTRYFESGQIKARLHFVDGMRGGFKGEMFWDEKGNKIGG